MCRSKAAAKSGSIQRIVNPQHRNDGDRQKQAPLSSAALATRPRAGLSTSTKP
jgi:hypothetical protein